MSEQTPPEIRLSLFSAARWLESLERRQDPTGVRVQHVRWLVGTAEESVPYLFVTDPWASSSVAAGSVPRYLGDEPDEPGVGLWQLTAPCVVVIATLVRKRLVTLEAVAVVSPDRFDRVQKRMRRPEPALMRSLIALIRLPRSQQRGLTNAPDPSPPNRLSDGRDPHGQA